MFRLNKYLSVRDVVLAVIILRNPTYAPGSTQESVLSEVENVLNNETRNVRILRKQNNDRMTTRNKLIHGHAELLKAVVTMVPAPARAASPDSSADGSSSSSEEADSDGSSSSNSSSEDEAPAAAAAAPPIKRVRRQGTA